MTGGTQEEQLNLTENLTEGTVDNALQEPGYPAAVAAQGSGLSTDLTNAGRRMTRRRSACSLCRSARRTAMAKGELAMPSLH